MSWQLRTSLGEVVNVVREAGAHRHDRTLRIPAISIRAEVRGWLRDPDGFDGALLLDMYRELQGGELAPWGNSPQILERHVLPVIEEAFAQGRLLAFRVPRRAVRAFVFPKEEPLPFADPAPTEWIEVAIADQDGNPYIGPYRIELPDGRVLSGQLNLGGRVRADGIPPGSCRLTLPDTDTDA
jgi:hypothetical protein